MFPEHIHALFLRSRDNVVCCGEVYDADTQFAALMFSDWSYQMRLAWTELYDQFKEFQRMSNYWNAAVEEADSVAKQKVQQEVAGLRARLSEVIRDRDALLRNEYICEKCGLRKDSDREQPSF